MTLCWVETDGLAPLLAETQARMRLLAFTAPSSAPVGWPSAWADPTGQEESSELTCVHGPLPSTGPAYSAPRGASRYPRLPVSTSAVASLAAPSVSPEVAVPTGAQVPPAAGAEESGNLGQLTAYAGPLPAHDAHTPNTP